MKHGETQGNLGLGPMPAATIQMLPDWQITALPNGVASSRLAQNGRTLEWLAERMGLAKSTVGKKINGQCGWMIDEFQRFANLTRSWAIQQYIARPMYNRGSPQAIDCGNGMVMVDKRYLEQIS